jgi:hypothetical protein
MPFMQIARKRHFIKETFLYILAMDIGIIFHIHFPNAENL